MSEYRPAPDSLREEWVVAPKTTRLAAILLAVVFAALALSLFIF